MASSDLFKTLPRVLIVSRRSIRKNKVVDFVGEYHLDLIVKYGAVPVIVPRVAGIYHLLSSFEPIHGVLLCEGEDVDSALYDSEDLLPEEKYQIRHRHESDTSIDEEKDSIETRLAKICLDRSIPLLGICRGSQVMNVVCGGSLYQDLETEMERNLTEHIDYENYDGHRHLVRVLEGTPMCDWFRDSFQEGMKISVNSYHHQGVKRLAERFAPMAFAPDGLVEGFYDPDAYEPGLGKFIVGLQFHPERMRVPGSEDFDYPGCSSPYQEFVKAVVSYEKRLNNFPKRNPKSIKFISASVSVGKNIYATRRPAHPSKKSQLEDCAEFLEMNNVMSDEREKMKVKEEKEGGLGRRAMEKMTAEQLSDLMRFYEMMGQICSQVLETKRQGTVNIKVS